MNCLTFMAGVKPWSSQPGSWMTPDLWECCSWSVTSNTTGQEYSHYTMAPSLQWRRRKGEFWYLLCGASSVLINGMVYCGSNEFCIPLWNCDPLNWVKAVSDRPRCSLLRSSLACQPSEYQNMLHCVTVQVWHALLRNLHYQIFMHGGFDNNIPCSKSQWKR
jgi:hypothetical protein